MLHSAARPPIYPLYGLPHSALSWPSGCPAPPFFAQPPAPRRLLITELSSSDAGSEFWGSDAEDDITLPRGGMPGAPHPLEGLLRVLGTGIVRLAVGVGEAFALVGNLLRRLGDDLRVVLAGAPGAARGPDGERDGADPVQRRWEAALVKVGGRWGGFGAAG